MATPIFTPSDIQTPDGNLLNLYDDSVCHNTKHLRMKSASTSKDTTIYYDSDPNYDVQFIKQQSLLQYSEEWKEEYLEKIECLQSSLDETTQRNEAYESQISALKQEGEYLREASNQWQIRFHDTNLSLLNANEERIILKKDLSDLQMLFQQSKNSIVLQHTQSSNDDDIQRTLKQYIDENTRLKKDNLKHLDELKQMNNECRQTVTKYDEITRDHMRLQKELCVTKSKASELDKLLHESLAEITYLQKENENLSHNLNEISNKEWLNPCDFDEKSIELKTIDFTPEPWPRRMRKRSLSRTSVFLESVCNSPVVRKSFTGDWNQYLADVFLDQGSIYHEKIDEEDHETIAMQDLFEQMNNYLTQIEECVEMIENIDGSRNKQRKNKHRRSLATNLCVADSRVRRSKSHDENTVDRTPKKKNRHSDETLLGVIETDKEEQLLMQIKEKVDQCKDNMIETEKQHAIMMTNEERKYTDLNKTFTRYQMETAKKIKRLTLDVYRTHYKKYSGYKDICWEMMGNMGTYTTKCIVHKLTH